MVILSGINILHLHPFFIENEQSWKVVVTKEGELEQQAWTFGTRFQPKGWRIIGTMWVEVVIEEVERSNC
jgi:hypothetical protein